MGNREDEIVENQDNGKVSMRHIITTCTTRTQNVPILLRQLRDVAKVLLCDYTRFITLPYYNSPKTVTPVATYLSCTSQLFYGGERGRMTTHPEYAKNAPYINLNVFCRLCGR